jgi:hypothetical protein
MKNRYLLMLYSDLAAHASARMGVRTLLVRLDIHLKKETI